MAEDMMKDIAKEVAKQAYDDMGKPVMKPFGEMVGLIPRAIHAALMPLEKWILYREYSIDQTKAMLAEKLKRIPVEMIESPEPYIAVPAIQSISYCMDNDELRNMYANLLANSMIAVIKNGVHPAFVDIIKQLCPDEAKILKGAHKNNTIPTIDIKWENDSYSNLILYYNYSDIGEKVGCENPNNISSYFDNLIRLGLLEKSPALSSLTNKELYEPLKSSPFVETFDKEAEIEGKKFTRDYDEGYVRLTAFGKIFCNICIEEPSANVNGTE